jgi:hypothetical protein
MERRWLNSVSVTVGDDGLLNRGPLATEAKQDAALAAMTGVTASMRTVAAPVELIKAVAVAGTAEKLVAASTLATYLIVTAKKAAANNAGNVFIGASTLDQSTREGVELFPGDTYERVARPGECFDLAGMYLDADTAADGVAGYYVPA